LLNRNAVATLLEQGAGTVWSWAAAGKGTYSLEDTLAAGLSPPPPSNGLKKGETVEFRQMTKRWRPALLAQA